MQSRISSGGKIPDFGTELLTEAELRHRLNLSSLKMVGELRRRRKIPFIKLGYRTIRYDWQKVAAALARLEIHEVGR